MKPPIKENKFLNLIGHSSDMITIYSLLGTATVVNILDAIFGFFSQTYCFSLLFFIMLAIVPLLIFLIIKVLAGFFRKKKFKNPDCVIDKNFGGIYTVKSYRLFSPKTVVCLDKQGGSFYLHEDQLSYYSPPKKIEDEGDYLVLPTKPSPSQAW